jgi:quinol monooxygenase YgiN
VRSRTSARATDAAAHVDTAGAAAPAVILAILEMTVAPEHEPATCRWLESFWETTSGLPGCIGGGVFHGPGRPAATLYLEIWADEAHLASHVRSAEYDQLLSIMETSASQPALTFGFTSELRGLGWVEEVRCGAAAGVAGSLNHHRGGDSGA